MGTSSGSDYLTTLAPECEQATTTTAAYLSALEEQIKHSKSHWSVLAKVDSNSSDDEVAADNRAADFLAAPRTAIKHATASSSAFVTAVEEQIEHSKRHWSQLTEPDSNFIEEEAAAEIDNREVFRTLQLHSTWGAFFLTFGYDSETQYSAGSLEVGSKFAEGAQAELFHARVTWSDPEQNEEDRKRGNEWVLKVFKKGTLLRYLQSQWPHGYLDWWAKELANWNSPLYTLGPWFHCEVSCATLLEDGRFAFLMKREDQDLRSFIDYNMLGNAHGCGPFSKEKGEEIMYRVALGMDWLHRNNIVHRDLKASNVLVNKLCSGNLACCVGDFECSIGVVGTGFWRAPEILQACKDKVVNQRQDLFTRGADAYSYGMTCYEILTGKLPFEHHPLSDNRPLLIDLVINGLRPEVPDFVDEWAHDLLRRCWQSNPAARPSFEEILSLFEAKLQVYYRNEGRKNGR